MHKYADNSLRKEQITLWVPKLAGWVLTPLRIATAILATQSVTYVFDCSRRCKMTQLQVAATKHFVTRLHVPQVLLPVVQFTLKVGVHMIPYPKKSCLEPKR